MDITHPFFQNLIMPQPLILFIDDEPAICDVMEYNLSKAGYRVLCARDGDEGYRLAKSQKPDLIVLDLMLPELDGLSVLRFLKAHNKTQHIPVVCLTAKSDEIDEIIGFELGAIDYITKPFRVRPVVRRIKAILDRGKTEVVNAGNPAATMYLTPLFVNRDFGAYQNYCFVLMPFTLSWSDRVWGHIRSLAVQEGFECRRADDIYGHDILEDIWTAINEATVIMADVTERNPNVMYEIGIAHTLGKEVILLTQNADDIPFDFRRYRHLVYADNTDGFALLTRTLLSCLRWKWNCRPVGLA